MAVNETTLIRRSENIQEPGSDATLHDRVRYLITRLRKTQQQFAAQMGIDGPNLSRILNGKIPFSDAMINRIVVNFGVSKNWLLTGEDVPFPKNVVRDIEVLEDETPRMLTRVEDGAPVYDIDATAGYSELSSMFTDDRIVGYLRMPQVDPRNSIIHVSGESMTPQIPNGSLISIRPVNPDSTIFWGQTYLVQLEDYRMIKVIRRHHNPEKVILHSNNPDYDDMEINRSEIKGLYVVDAVIKYNLLA